MAASTFTIFTSNKFIKQGQNKSKGRVKEVIQDTNWVLIYIHAYQILEISWQFLINIC